MLTIPVRGPETGESMEDLSETRSREEEENC